MWQRIGLRLWGIFYGCVIKAYNRLNVSGVFNNISGILLSFEILLSC